MNQVEVVLLAIGLSMDSLAVSVTSGTVIRNCTVGNILKISSVMGISQASMVVIGYFAGLTFAQRICDFDHWIAFLLLLYLGGKMMYDSLTKGEEEENPSDPLKYKVLFGLSIATSIDALAVGVSLALLNTSILLHASTIGIITFLMSAAGVFFGSKVGLKVNLKLDFIGGCILIAIGSKILIEHLFFTA